MISTTNRNESLDYLRGLMALAVLIFHYDKWTSGYWDAQTPQGRLGVYAVSVFFILSGIALAIAYVDRIKWSIASWQTFYQKRFWRIFPLLGLVTVVSVCLDEFQRPITDILLNITGLFGWINPARDIATGAWSIGCELVYYAFFPLVLLVSLAWRWFLPGLFALLAIITAYIAFNSYELPNPGQEAWWPIYVQPLNHALFFVAGVWIGLNQRAKSPFYLLVFTAATATFFLWPIGQDPFSLVYGLDRLVLSVLILLMVAGYTYIDIRLPENLAVMLRWLGLVSYSLYLWHPIVYRTVQFGFRKMEWENEIWVITSAFLLSLLVSHLSYRCYERPMQEKFRPAKQV